MTPEQLDEIERLSEAATPGPWVWYGPSSDAPADLWTADGQDAIVCVQTTNADVRFIQAMREHAMPLVKALREAWVLNPPNGYFEDIDRLTKERDEARAEVEQLRAAITRFVNQYPWQQGPEIQELKALKEGAR